MVLTAESLVNQSLELVSAPTTYTQLAGLIEEESTSMNDLSEVIATDPALTTRILKVVNSPYYGFPSQITTIARAITLVGTNELIQLVLATSVINSFKGIPADLINMNEFWRHSVACAIAADLIAKQCKLARSEVFFTAGLLHNIGSLVLYQSLPELAREALISAKFGHETIQHAEARIIGFDHCMAGEALTRKWRLPNALSEVARFHHAPSQAEQFTLEAAIVHIADILVSSTDQFGHSGDSHVPPLDVQAWELLAIEEQALPDILLQVTEKIDDLTSALTSH